MDRIESLLGPQHSLTTPNKRWHSAFVSIYCSRALLSFFKDSLLQKNLKLSPSPSFVILDLNPDLGFKVDQPTLTNLVKDKKIERLQNIGGVDALAFTLQTDVARGIHGNDVDIARRHEAFGSNTYKRPPTKSFFHFLVEASKDLTILILLGCAVLSLVFGIKENGIKEGWYDGGSIFVAIFLVIAVSTISNFKQNRQFDKLSKVNNNIQIEVVRAGRRQQISIFEIVVGDVICLKIGDQVPADGLFLDGHSLQVDESSMTGESDHVEVNCSHPFLFSGTKVVDGYARMIVTSVGMNTIWGEMMSSISRDTNEQTPLQVRLNKLTSSIGKVGLAVAFLVLVVLLVRYFTGNTTDENGNKEFNGSSTKADEILNAVVGFVAAAVTIVVVAIPEGLSLAVTLTLAYSMKRMMADQAMVRKLSACETMGSATTICTDKTGTLTLNKMKVTKFWLGKESFAPATYSSIAPYILELLQEGVALNTTGSVYRPTLGSEIEFSGSPTEQAILSWAILELNMEMEQLTQSRKILYVEAFNSQKKRSGVITRRRIDNTIHVHWKGAAEMILKMCSSYYDASGIMKDLDDSEKMKFEQRIQGMAASSLRCIAFAHKKISKEDQEHDMEQKKIEEDGLTLLGLVGIKDPCRPGVKKAVEDCQNAGVNIKMITGDNVFTAKAIATECGILRFDQDMSGAVVEGIEFRNYTPEERMEKVDKICVMARSSPFDKLLMVQCLKQKGHVIAVTGDGTNDAPALKEADVGLSMGIQGTEVAKESSDIVILDDNFASVAIVLRWGRCVYNNIQKFIQFQLTVNVAALVINFVAAVLAGEVPLTAVQLLWVNLIMDTLGALALATEKPTGELMTKPPVGRTEPLITNIMWRNLLAQALYQIIVLLTLQFKGESIFGVTKKVNDTLIFNTFVLCQVFNEFNARKLEKKNVFKGIHRNKLFLGIIAMTIVLQVVMVEFLKKFAGTERLNWEQWGECIGFGIVSWPIGWIVKWIPVPKRPFLSYLNMKKMEGLPTPFLTHTLAYPMKRMMADQAMVRKLSAYETMGSTTTISTDKIDTFTLNKMKVTKFWLGKESFAPATYSSIAPYILELLQEGVALNTTGSVYRPTLGSKIELSSSPTEEAIRSWAILELNMEMEQLKQSRKILYIEAFNSQNKRSGVITRRKIDNTIHIHWKGATKIILEMCSSYYDTSGIMKDLDNDEKMKFEQIIQGMAASSLQCIAFAHKQISEEDQEHVMGQRKIEEDGLTLLGLVGIKDPCRPGVKKAVENFENVESLTQLVEEKKIESLQNFGGVDEVASTLKTNVECGIQGDDEDIAHRHKAFGSNKYKTPPTKSLFHFVVEEFKDHSTLINLGCATSSLAFGIKENGIGQGWYDGGSIYVSLFLVIVLSAILLFRQNRQFDKLTEVSNKIQIDVVRAGRRQQISIFEIVVGDVIFLNIGDQVPANGLFLDGHSLQVDESSMTGENDRVEVNCSHPFLLSGTKVIDGNARMLVTSVGMNTKWGKMMSSISNCNTNHQTPLQTRLKELTSSIGKLGLAVAFLVLIILFYRYFTGNIKDENGNKEFNGSTSKVCDILNAVVGILAAAITIVEVVTPKGFPLAVQLTQIYSMKKMMADQAMVRKLFACETIGSITTICTNKTGTLTLNKMTVTQFWLGKAPATYTSINSYILKLQQEGVALNTTGNVYRPTLRSEIEFSGSPTEQAILSWSVLELNMEMEQLKQSCKILYVEAFNSQKKRSGVITRRKIDNTIHVHWKGAAEMILKMCSSYYDASGIMKDLDDGEKMQFEQIIQGMAASNLRCIAFAHKQILEEDQEHDMEQKKIEEDGLTLLGLVGIKDPCCLGVKKVVESCQYAGVNVKMITKDNVLAAKAIATECGILRLDQDMGGAVVEGVEFRNYTPEERMEKVDKICVLVRSSTFDKLLMVKCLKQKGHVVAITGHCTNDSPALKEADVGLSMGIQGTEVAKESLDIVILDDDFALVAKILRWGRCVFKNIQKFIQFQLTVNVAAITVNLVAIIYVNKGPLTGVQLLWVNLITHTLGALALATEQPTKELMKKPPIDQTKPLITNIMWRNLLAQALYQIVVLLILQFKGESIFSVTEKVNDTLIFTTFVLCQVFNEFNARKLKKKNVFEGILKNKLFMEIIAITIVLQVVMVELLKKFTGSERLNWGQWGTCIGFAIISWPIGWIVKWIPVPKRPFLSYLNTK